MALNQLVRRAAARLVSRHAAGVDYLYSLYDALVSINVPSDKARAVVDAMERDMGTTLATKQDLRLLAQRIESRFALVAQQFAGLESRLQHRIETVELRMTVKMGSMMAVGFGLMIAALRLWA